MDQQIEKLKDVSACLAAIDKTDPQLKAWVELEETPSPKIPMGH